MKCFYHDDADGICSAFWVASNAVINDKNYYNDEPQFHEINYRRKFPLEIIRPKEQVYIIDYSIKPDEMRELIKVTKNITWIDHHKTAIEEYENFEYDIRGIRYSGVAACMLTYCYLKHMTRNGEGNIKAFEAPMIEDAPLFTKLISDGDVLEFKYGDDTKNFFNAFNAYNLKPQASEWYKFMTSDNYEKKMIEEGRAIAMYEKAWAKYYMKLGFKTIFEEHTCFAINLGYSGVEFFESLPEKVYDIFISFAFDGMQYIVSLYSKTVDVSNIAKKYGGGGHKMAAGFQCDILPFSRVDLK